MTKKLGILGCGWYGTALAKSVLRDGYQVWGSTSTSAKLENLERLNISAVLLKVTPSEILGDVDAFFSSLEALVISIPPKLRQQSAAEFLSSIQVIAATVKRFSNISKVIYISSTSVFQDRQNLPTYDELYSFSEGDILKSEVLQSEFLLLKNIDNLKVLRFGGLIGEDRHPVHYLAGKSGLKSPDTPVNLIHQRDCVGLTQALLNQYDALSETFFHGVNPEHPKRQLYYETMAKQYGLDAPQFETELPQQGKLVSSDLTSKAFNYVYFKSLKS